MYKKPKSRWDVAQKYESNWWKNNANFISDNYYKIVADNLRNMLKTPVRAECRIVEIGCGPIGIVTFLTECEHRYALDPLNDFFINESYFNKFRDSNVKYLTSKGEKLDFADNSFDICIMDNVLDHCENPDNVLSEIYRVLDDGYFYFTQNTYTFWGKFLRKFTELFMIDKGHPHTYTKNALKKQFKHLGFNVLEQTQTGYFSQWQRLIKSKRFYDKIQALLLIPRNKVTFFCKLNKC